jgi:hypothetical protein
VNRVLRGGVLEPGAGAWAPGLSLAGGAYIDSCFFSSWASPYAVVVVWIYRFRAIKKATNSGRPRLA